MCQRFPMRHFDAAIIDMQSIFGQSMLSFGQKENRNESFRSFALASWPCQHHIMFENDILETYSQKSLGVFGGDFWGFGCPKDTQTPCWLRLCLQLRFLVYHRLLRLADDCHKKFGLIPNTGVSKSLLRPWMIWLLISWYVLRVFPLLVCVRLPLSVCLCVSHNGISLMAP